MLTFTKAKPSKVQPPEARDAERIATGIPKIKEVDTPLAREYRATTSRLHELQAMLPQFREKLRTATSGGGSADRRFERERVAQDGAAIAGGADLDILACETTQDQYATIRRQIAAVESAISHLEDEAKQLYLKLQFEEIAKLAPLGEEVGGDLIRAYSHLAFILERNHQLYTLMHQKGFDHVILDATPWNVTPFDSSILHGVGGRISLAAWIENRKQAWKLNK